MQVAKYKGLAAGQDYKPHSHLSSLQRGDPEALFNASTLRPIQHGLDLQLEAQFGYSYQGAV